MNKKFDLERLDKIESLLLSLKSEMVKNFKQKEIENRKIEKRLIKVECKLFNCKAIITLEEAAELLGCSKSQLYKLTSNKIIPHYKPSGKMVYFEVNELYEWLRQYHVAADEIAIKELSKLKLK